MCSLIKRLNNINEKLLKEAELIKQIVVGNQNDVSLKLFEKYTRFEKVKKEPNLETDGPGIYVFRISTNKSIPVLNFDTVQYGAKTNIHCGSSFENENILYLGKTEESLESRLKEHISNPGGRKTYSLRLSDPARCHLLGHIDLYIFRLKNEYFAYKKIILSTIESRLHDICEPVVGTSR